MRANIWKRNVFLFFCFFQRKFSGTYVVFLNKVVTRYFDKLVHRPLQLWTHKLKCKYVFWFTIWWLQDNPCWAFLIIGKPIIRHFSCTSFITCWHLRSIMPFIMVFWTLIDTLFDQIRYTAWISVWRCQKCKMSHIRIVPSVFVLSLWV